MNKTRRIVSPEVVSLVMNDEEADLPLLDVLKALQKAFDSIPSEFYSTAVVRVRAYGDYASASVDVVYKRPETDEEYNARLAEDEHYKRQSEIREREIYEALKRKFGS
jgi:hypothetical protein